MKMGRRSQWHPQVRLHPRWLCALAFSLLALMQWRSAAAQPELEYIGTSAGVAVAVPGGLGRLTGLGGLPGGGAQISGVATLTDGQQQPLTVHVQEGSAHGLGSLPARSEDLAADWTQLIAERLGGDAAYDFAPGHYDPARFALRISYKVRGPSHARLLGSLPVTHPLWARAARAGLDAEPARCAIAGVLGGAASVRASALGANTSAVARNCGLTEAAVAGFLAQLGPEEFAPSVTAMTVVVFFTRLGTVVTAILAPLDRQDAVDAAAAIVWKGTQVDAAVRLPTDAPAPGKAFETSRLVGVVIGALLAVFALGAALSWLQVRLGVRPLQAVPLSLGLLVALALLGLMLGRFSLESRLQVVCYALASLAAYRPLLHWLSKGSHGAGPRPPGWRLRGDERGLSTVEYVVILVLVVAVGIGAWSALGQSIKRSIGLADQRLEPVSAADFGGTESSSGMGAPGGDDSAGVGSLADGRPRSGAGPSTPGGSSSGALSPGGRSEPGSAGLGRAPEASGAAATELVSGTGSERVAPSGAGRASLAGGTGSARPATSASSSRPASSAPAPTASAAGPAPTASRAGLAPPPAASAAGPAPTASRAGPAPPPPAAAAGPAPTASRAGPAPPPPAAAAGPAPTASRAGPAPPPPAAASAPRDPVPLSVTQHPPPPPPPPPEPEGLSELAAGAIGFGLGVAQGSAPGGFLTNLIPVPEPLRRSRAYQYWNGAGQVITGVTQVVAGVGGEVIGVGADATGVGAVVGVPLNVASAAVIVNGVAATGTGLAQMAAASQRPPTERATSGETSATARGKDVHAERAAERRASGEWDEVNQTVRNADGEPIEVPHRVDPKTGEPVGTQTQTARPDAVSYKRGQILDDKPLGRPISKDRQEIVRFIKAYEERTGQMPKQIVIERYDPKTGAKVLSETYNPQDFLP